MRELNECVEEVFRRSDERIKRRRKVCRRAVAFCVPLCICIAVLASMIKPPAVKSDSVGCSMFSKSENFCSSYVEVKAISAAGLQIYCYTETDQTKTEQLRSMVQDISEQFFGIGADGDSEYGGDDCMIPTAGNAAEFDGYYTITFSNSDGTETVYTLMGHILKNDRGEAAELTDEYLSELKEAIAPKE